jgi:hypothetical protein
MEPASLPALRALLLEAGYAVLAREDRWCECFVHRDAERWLGRGATADEAFGDAVDKLLPSHLSRMLLARHAPPAAESLGEVLPPAPIAARATSIDGAAPLPPTAQEAAFPAPDEPLPLAADGAASPPAAAPLEEPEVAGAPLVEPATAESTPVDAAPATEIEPAAAEPLASAPELPALPAAGPANEVPAAPLAPSAEATPHKPSRARTTEALETVEQLLASIEERLGALARMNADRQRLNMLVWICRARAVEESLPGAREVEHAVARVARRLTEIGKMFWPGSVRALQLSARPADVRREMHATWETESANWTEATQLAERLLNEHLARSAETSLDEDGWADGAARLPKPADPDALFHEVDAELKAMLIPPGEVPNGRMGELGPIEFEGLLNAARKLRWLRGAVKDDLAWGIAMGRLRRAVPGLGERAGRVREALDHRLKPSTSWAKTLGEREAAPISEPKETAANLEAALPAARESKEALMAWLIRAFDVLNTPDLVVMLAPIKDDIAAFNEETLNHPDRRVRRRLRDLVRQLASAVPESTLRTKEPAPEHDEEETHPDEPIAIQALDLLSARVRAETKGRRALFVSNRDDPELGAKLTDLLGISITWCDGSLRRVQAACERIARGSYDLILSATGFQVHGVDTALARAAGAAGVPYVRVNRGRPVACVQAIAREFGLNTNPLPQKASSAG